MGFANLKTLVEAEVAGQSTYHTWRKSPSQVTPAGVWFDLSMSPGTPIPQYYAAAPLKATPLAASTDGGLYHGGSPGGTLTKHLRKFSTIATSSTGLPLPMMLLDYLMFYPFIDEGTTDAQSMDNTQTLPRYSNGAGVKIMAVSLAGRTGGQTFQVTYTNQAGVAGRVSQVVLQNTVSVNGSIVTCQNGGDTRSRGAFIPLQTGDTGVRSIQSVQMISGVDVGLFALVLVQPLAQASIRAADAAVEIDYLVDFSQTPEIKPDAYVNLICCPSGSLAATTLYGDITTVWSS